MGIFLRGTIKTAAFLAMAFFVFVLLPQAQASDKDLLRYEALSSRYDLSDEVQADNILALIRGEMLSEADNPLKALVEKISDWHNAGREAPKFEVTREDVVLFRKQTQLAGKSAKNEGRRNEYLIFLKVGPGQNRYTGKIIAATYSQSSPEAPAVYRIFEPELAEIQLD